RKDPHSENSRAAGVLLARPVGIALHAAEGGGGLMKVQWEYDLVERPFCEQLKAMGWQWIEGDKDVPDFTERGNFLEVLLKGRLATALRKLNLRDGQPWLDDDRIRRIIEKLEK